MFLYCYINCWCIWIDFSAIVLLLRAFGLKVQKFYRISSGSIVKLDSVTFHQVPWFLGIPSDSIGFRQIPCFRGIPPDSMLPWDSVRFHRIPSDSMLPWDSVRFHRIPGFQDSDFPPLLKLHLVPEKQTIIENFYISSSLPKHNGFAACASYL